MIRFNLENPFSPPLCRGAELVVPAVFSGLGLASDVIGGTRTNSYNSHLQQEENQKNRDFQAEEAEKQRKYESREAQIARQWQSAEWYSQFLQGNEEWYKQQSFSNDQAYQYWLKQQEYNTPAAQAQRLAQAGFNPSAVIGNSTYGSSGLSAAPTGVQTPSTPSAAIPAGSAASGISSQMPHLNNPLAQYADFINSVGSLFKNLNSGTYDSAMANSVSSKLSYEVGLMSIKMQREEVGLRIDKAAAEFAELTNNTRIQQEYKKLLLLDGELELKGAQVDTELEKQYELHMAGLMHYADTHLKGAQRDAVLFQLTFDKATAEALLRLVCDLIRRLRSSAVALSKVN